MKKISRESFFKVWVILVMIWWGVSAYLIHIHIRSITPDYTPFQLEDLWMMLPILVLLIFLPLCKKLSKIVTHAVIGESLEDADFCILCSSPLIKDNKND